MVKNGLLGYGKSPGFWQKLKGALKTSNFIKKRQNPGLLPYPKLSKIDQFGLIFDEKWPKNS